MILRVQQGLLDDGANASLSQLCHWFEGGITGGIQLLREQALSQPASSSLFKV